MAEFTGKDYEEALGEAEKYFNASGDSLNITIVQEGKKSLFKRKPWIIEAAMKHIAASEPAPVFSQQAVLPAQEEEEDLFEGEERGNFHLEFTPDGVMLYAQSGADASEVLSYCNRRQISDVDTKAITHAIRRAGEGVTLAPPMEEAAPPADDAMEVRIAKDEMKALMRILPGDDEGTRLTAQMILDELQNTHKITHGIDREKIDRALEQRRVRRDIAVAKGTPVIHGEEGLLQFHFQRTHSRRPKVNAANKVDYRTLDLFESVNKEQVLITRTLATTGTEGITLRGKAIPPKRGRDVVMPRGRGITFNEEKSEMYAAHDGMVDYVNGQVVVSNRYVVDGNADMSIGNIDFLGDVEILGNVIAGMTIKAEGSVEVHGTVEAATIIAGGTVLLRQGMQGMDRGKVIAGQDVVARFFERTKVVAQGTITIDASYHSELSAVDSIVLTGRHASLIGGITRSTTQVVARVIGSTSHTSTVVEVGILPEQRERHNHLEMELRRLGNEYDKVNMMARSFTDERMKDKLTPEREALRDRVMVAKEQIQDSTDLAQQEFNYLTEKMENVTSGKVHALETIYPGAKVVIGSSHYSIENPIDYATFHLVEGEVVFGACDYNQ